MVIIVLSQERNLGLPKKTISDQPSKVFHNLLNKVDYFQLLFLKRQCIECPLMTYKEFFIYYFAKRNAIVRAGAGN
jgi:hypothetical protein